MAPTVPASASPTPPGHLDALVVGGDRPVKVALPPGVDPSVPAPLLMLLHGYGSSGDEEETYLRLGAAAAQNGVIYLHPDGTTDSYGARFWNATDTRRGSPATWEPISVINPANGSSAVRERQQVQRQGRPAREAPHQSATVAGVGLRPARGARWLPRPRPRVRHRVALAGERATRPGELDPVLTDSSEGMLAETRRRVDGLACRVEYRAMDAQEVTFPDGAFDIVIASHMLYHVPDRGRAIAEARRVLREGGAFHATTASLDSLAELRALMHQYRSVSNAAREALPTMLRASVPIRSSGPSRSRTARRSCVSASRALTRGSTPTS